MFTREDKLNNLKTARLRLSDVGSYTDTAHYHKYIYIVYTHCLFGLDLPSRSPIINSVFIHPTKDVILTSMFSHLNRIIPLLNLLKNDELTILCYIILLA